MELVGGVRRTVICEDCANKLKFTAALAQYNFFRFGDENGHDQIVPTLQQSSILFFAAVTDLLRWLEVELSQLTGTLQYVSDDPGESCFFGTLNPARCCLHEPIRRNIIHTRALCVTYTYSDTYKPIKHRRGAHTLCAILKRDEIHEAYAFRGDN
ncbi:hypothetical protein NDU88_003520 [Pleurodeles waltl]|uniref:Yippee domain-containing protein n=1 Tax=Pleurodeles waltl TaxID=8319 RepID=A0AAV7SFM9_PLEWA|nr:hypothetical protein NDU88_003520 [Pleurodeles waltl]